MIIYGTKTVILKTVNSKTDICPYCKTHGSIFIRFYSKYAYLLWIPMFPISKTVSSECEYCKYDFELFEIPDNTKKEYNRLKSDIKVPIWQFIGLVFLLLWGAWGVYVIYEDNKLELGYVAEPHIDDVYEVRIESEKYSTFKVVGVSKDSVFVLTNNYIIDQLIKLNTIDKFENYSDESIGISRKIILEMYDDGDIIDIRR